MISFEEEMPNYLPLYRQSLEKAILNEHLGLNPNEEVTLRQSLQANGINLHSDILYGRFVDPKTREFWQEQGWDPDSEDEVYDLQRQNGAEDHPSTPGKIRKLRV